MTTTTSVLLLIAIGVGLFAGLRLLIARRRVRQGQGLPAYLAAGAFGALLASMVAFAVWPVLHYAGLRGASAALRDVPSAPFLLVSGALLAVAAGSGTAWLVVSLTARRGTPVA